MPDRERKRVPDDRFNILKGSLTQGLPCSYPSPEHRQLSKELKKESRDEVKQLRVRLR